MIALIAAVSKNRVIGKNGKIPWSLPEDMAHFKALTTGNVLIMGRKTFEEMGKPLPGRFSIIISTTKKWKGKTDSTSVCSPDFHSNYQIFRSFEEALALAKKITEEIIDLPDSGAMSQLNPYFNTNIFICGGSSVYEKAIPLVEKMYLTEIHAEFDGDAYFPQFDPSAFEKIIEKPAEKNPDFSYDFVSYSRK